ncbi:hypothetical protein ZWY2020_012950 [Hordeum vulgare]|uniref:Uncharacterized protein n=1 Tax=Hordeum vulgare subsp. vulgare TaxID=112509 RepID=A0A8I6XCU7_HORVV|nr:hypothetical protein ZWY2020_012950 [Hordeum vulgare]
MAATQKPQSPFVAAAADEHLLRPGTLVRLRFLRPGALARLRDARLRRQKRNSSRLVLASPQPPPSPRPALAPAAAVGGESGPFMPNFVTGSRLLAPRCPQRKKLMAGKVVALFFPPMPSQGLPFEAVM